MKHEITTQFFFVNQDTNEVSATFETINKCIQKSDKINANTWVTIYKVSAQVNGMLHIQKLSERYACAKKALNV